MESVEIWEPTNEPNWTLISHRYVDLGNATRELSNDLRKYQATLSELDGLGTSISNSKERIYLLREEIAQMESKP